MGPDHDTGLLPNIAAYQRAHPTVIIRTPAETLTGLWEVSFPGASAIAFDNPVFMLTALARITPIPDEDE